MEAKNNNAVFLNHKSPFFIKSSLLVFAQLFAFVFAIAQGNIQAIRGSIVDNVTKQGLVGVTIYISGSKPLITAESDTNGNYRMENILPGRYDLSINYLGYQAQTIPNVLVTSGKEVVLDIEMVETVGSLKEVEVRGNKRGVQNEMSTISARSFSMEEVNRYSGGMGDPSRLAANFAGVVTPNDQRNDLVIRGNSPLGVLWRIDGLNVPNINHFSTLGSTGGPVSALNTNVLKNSDFMTSAFAPEYGNATAGVFDVGFRKGSITKAEHTIQFGAVTGLEAMTEGPINKSKGSSYMVAYRYAFTALAHTLGIKIGTAATPKYQDLSFKINGGQNKYGQFSIFGLGGYSHIDFLHDELDKDDVFSDPTRDSYFKSTIGVMGISHSLKIGKKSNLKSVLGANYAKSDYDQDSINSINNNPYRIVSVNNQQINYSLNTALSTKHNSKFSTKVGVITEFMSLKLFSETREFSPQWIQTMDFKGSALLTQEYIQGKFAFNDKVSFTGGLHSQQFSLNNAVSFEPRIAFKYKLTNKNSITLGYGLHSQTQPLSVYFYKQPNGNGSFNTDNEKLGFSRSQHFVIGYEFIPNSDWRIKSEAYFQLLQKIPVTLVASSFSILNEGASFTPTQVGNLVNTGTGTNMGIELTIEKFFTKGYYALLTASLYDAQYKGSDGIERNTAFNGQHTFNLLAGKEFKMGASKRNAFTIDTKITSAGGRYYTPVDLIASKAAGQQILVGDANAFSERLPDYFRFDLKFGYRMNSKKRKLSQTISFDLQNLSGQKNVFARQYNRVNQEINTTYQNGFIPNFVYKLNF